MTELTGLKILNSKEFESEIRSIMNSKTLSIIDAIVHFCEQRNIEVETAASLVSPRLKSEIEAEAIAARMIISKKARLPI